MAGFGDILNAGTNLFGIHEQNRFRESEERRQYDFAQQGLQWRVADAQKAGVHPLFALGANLPASSPIQADFGAYDKMGQSLARAANAGSDENTRLTNDLQRRLLVAQIKKVNAEADVITGQMSRSQAVGNSPGTAQSGIPFGGTGLQRDIHDDGNINNFRDAVAYEPLRVPSRRFEDSGVTAASSPGLQEYDLGQGQSIWLPSREMAESWEDMPILGQAYIIAENLRRGRHLDSVFDDIYRAGNEYERAKILLRGGAEHRRGLNYSHPGQFSRGDIKRR